MTTARFTVVTAGPQVSIQDRGRFGHLRFGAPASGPMDRGAAAIANLALGNSIANPLIEISRGGLVLDCVEGQISMCVAGGGFQVSLDEEPCPAWSVTGIRSGQRLSIRPGPWGSWTYLAFAGKMLTKTWLGSAATHATSNLGGGALLPGARLDISDAECRAERHRRIACPVSSRPRHAVRVILGPQDRFFAADTLQTFLSHPFVLTDAYDRMGVRLAGPLLRPSAPLDMPSEPILRGSVQVAGDGVATVLLADHQTTGGYPKIATILSTDLDGFAQLRPRDSVVFEAVTPEAAIAAHRTRHKAHARFLASWDTVHTHTVDRKPNDPADI